MREYTFHFRNPHTGTVRYTDKMDPARAAVSNHHLKLNGRRFRWQRPHGKKWITPAMPPPTPSSDSGGYILVFW